MKVSELFEDVRISNVRKGDPLYDELAKLAKDEMAFIRGKARTKDVEKLYNGASFIVVGFKDPTREPYFRIDKADIKKTNEDQRGLFDVH
jgi:hypothetical protein